MSLKGDRYEAMTELGYFCNFALTRGGVASAVTEGSGAALDQSQAAVNYVASPSGARPVGILMGDVVNYDLTRQHINFQRDEVQLGGKVRLMRKGFVVTNNIQGTPFNGDSAYLGASGLIIPRSTTNQASTNYVASMPANLNPQIGYFATTLDEDGYARVQVDL